MDALRALDYAVKELEEAKDKSFEEHLYAFKKVLQKAIEMRKDMVS